MMKNGILESSISASGGEGRRNRFFLRMCSRNCISFIISIDILFVVVMVIYQDCQVMVTSSGFCWYSGGAPRVPIVGVPATSEERW